MYAPIRVLGVGMCTPIGMTTARAYAAHRAKLARFQESDTLGRDGYPIRASFLSTIPQAASRLERMQALATHALDDLRRAVSWGKAERVGVWIGSPTATSELGRSMDALTRHVLAAPARPAFMPYGRSAFFFALDEAIKRLTTGDCDVAIVGAVDSLCAAETLRRLDADSRVLGSAVDGLLPGEGAAFVALRRSTSAARGEAALGSILQVSTHREPYCFEQDLPSAAVGLTEVFRQIRLGGVRSNRRPDRCITSETGESFWAEEFSQASLRNAALMPEPLVRSSSAEVLGDMGAGAGAVGFGLEVWAMARSHRCPGALSLVCGSSDDGHVGAGLVGDASWKEAT